MKQQEVFNKIGSIIKELNDQYKYLQSNPEDLNALELELFVANAHFLANHAEILNKINSQNSFKPVKPAAETKKDTQKEKYFEPVVTQGTGNAKTERTDKPLPEIDLTKGSTKDKIIRHELIVDDEDLHDDEELYGEYNDLEDKASGPKVKPVAGKKMADIQEEILTINQKMSSKLDSGQVAITEKINAQPVTDLKPAITLNDKMLYVKDLFNGYSLAYSEAIDILNRFNSFDEAERFLNKNYVTKNNWTDKQETMDKFFELLRRRYS